jgi:LmbE family N-acetylglucosaminyl deacetylase
VVTFSAADAGTGAHEWTADPRFATLPRVPLDPAEVEHVVVVAAHPDDESLGAGGLLSRAARSGLKVSVVVATDGEASHPASPTHSADQLRSVRRDELRRAVSHLAPNASVERLGFPDGRLPDHEEDLLVSLVELIGDGRRTLLAAPWRHDGHPDHEAAGRVAAAAAARTGAGLLEYPIWFWHWGTPSSAPWERLRVLVLDDVDVTAKTGAHALHRSQVEPLSDQPGDEVLLGPDLLQHFTGGREVYVADAPVDLALDDLHADEADPWGTDSRWYETRKRALLLAALPRAEFRHGLEVGSSTGALAADLATRCRDLLVIDAGDHAVAAAGSRLGSLDHARVERRTVPHEWPEPPEQGFDLIVLSEVGYFLSPRDLDDVVDAVRASLAPDGVLVLCHWRHEINGWPLDGPDVHALMVAAGIRPVAARYVDRDFELLVLTAESVLPDPQAGS